MKHITLPVTHSQASQTVEYGRSVPSETVHYRDVAVEADGTVRAWDPIGEIYSIHHDLTPEQEEEARQIAAEMA